MSPHATLQLIAQILAFTANATELEAKLRNFKDTDWEDLVKIASSHLVLTTIYCRLKQKALLHLLPQDLVTYLQDLTAINRNRNITIAAQINTISQLLQQHRINHVFLKGAALLIAGYYNDVGERMIGDIDLLVQNDDLEEASTLLRSNGYQYKSTTFGAKYFEYHHDIRLILNKNGIAAVELHRHILHTKNNNYLITNNILQHKCIHQNLPIPSKMHLIENIILNFEINDYGYQYNHLKFRNAYDYICVTQDYPIKDLQNICTISKYHRAFIAKISFYFKEYKTYKMSTIEILRHKIFIHNSKKDTVFKKIYHYYAKSTIHSKMICSRLLLFITNTNYRKEAWQDKARLIQLLKRKFF